MNANEMFNKIKFYKQKNVQGGDLYIRGGIEYCNLEPPKIYFNKSRRIVQMFGNEGYITIDEIEAIYQKIKELGWLNKE